MSLQYSGSYDTDACSSPACGPALSATSSLTQGEMFSKMTAAFHGGRRSRRAHRRSSRKMHGGMASYPNDFSQLLPQDMHKAADIGRIDTAYAQLPEFVGKYGLQTGGKRTRKMRGGVAPVTAPAMILSAAEEPQAFLNPQWYTENQVNPSFRGPVNPAAVQQAANQFNYAQKAGKRRSRKAQRKHRKSRSRKAQRKHRKSRK